LTTVGDVSSVGSSLVLASGVAPSTLLSFTVSLVGDTPVTVAVLLNGPDVVGKKRMVNVTRAVDAVPVP
jgi:hypothetical protein